MKKINPFMVMDFLGRESMRWLTPTAVSVYIKSGELLDCLMNFCMCYVVRQVKRASYMDTLVLNKFSIIIAVA